MVRNVSEKKNTTLYLSIDLVDKARRLGINISNVVEKILELLVEQDIIADESVKLAVLTWENERINVDIENLEKKIQALHTRQHIIAEKMKQEVALIEEIRHSQKVANVMRRLNSKIVETVYDVEKSLEVAKEEIAELKTLGIDVTEQWMHRHVERLGRIAYREGVNHR